MGLIYKITNPNGKIYVGQTSQTLHERMKQHKCIRDKRKKTAINNSIVKYGFEAHIIEILEDNIPDELLNEREIYWIMKIDVSGVKLQLKKRAVICYAGEDVIEYANPNEAAAALGLWHQTIKDAANLGKPLRNGYRFVYKDSLNQNQNRPYVAGPMSLNGKN